MSDKLPRRNFISRLSLAITSALAMPISGVAKDLKKTLKLTDMNPIIKIKPLGFQWDTADPFLFCVHHEDKFPKGNEVMGPSVCL